ncbi:MAG TPA: hypothetical protein VIX73_01040, partial [Kofleriaceae bacterium]
MTLDRRGESQHAIVGSSALRAPDEIGKVTLTQALPLVTAPEAAQAGRAATTSSPTVQRKPDPQAADPSTRSPLQPVQDIATLFGLRSGVHAVQCTGTDPKRAAGQAAVDITPPIGGIDKTGFVDNSDGAFVRTGPREAGGTPVRAEPLAPATRVFATGRHPSAPEWIYVTAFPPREMVRGYVQGPRINFDLPEPLAELRQLVGGETPEELAREKFGHMVRDGHDLRFYENVLLYVNKGRDGISGTYQDPGALGGGANNIKLFKGHRIWLVSAEFAKSLESVVPSGSLT